MSISSEHVQFSNSLNDGRKRLSKIVSDGHFKSDGDAHHGLHQASLAADVLEGLAAEDSSDTYSTNGTFLVRTVECSTPGVLAICPMQKAEAFSWWTMASVRWAESTKASQERSTTSSKRLAATENVQVTPSKRPRSGDSPTGSPYFSPSGQEDPRRPVADGVTNASTATVGSVQGGAFRCGSDAEPVQTQARINERSPSPSRGQPATVAGQFAARSAAALVSPKPSRRRGSATPGTSPRAQLKYNSSTETCGICFDDVEQGTAVRLGCRHGWYCTKCMVKHAEARLEVGAAYVPCPECVVPIAECNLRKLLPPEHLDRLLARSLEQAVSSTAGLWACPTPNCPMRVAVAEDEEPRLHCTLCKKESCLRCGAQPYHRNLTCEEYAARAVARGRGDVKSENSFKKWMMRVGAKQCPTCGMAVTKQDLASQGTQKQECHKMMCRNCGSKFCFKCTKVLSENFTCGCSIDAHGFVNPFDGKRVEHLRKKPGKKGRGRGAR